MTHAQFSLLILSYFRFSPLQWFSRLLTFFLAITFALTLILCFAFLVTLQNVVFPRFNWLLTVSNPYHFLKLPKLPLIPVRS